MLLHILVALVYVALEFNFAKRLFQERLNKYLIMVPFEQPDNSFYLTESPEMLDSIFSAVNYPGIDSLFPEDGMLLVLMLNLNFGKEITDHMFSFSNDTVQVEYTVRSWLDGLYAPFVWQIVFPIGITFEE